MDMDEIQRAIRLSDDEKTVTRLLIMWCNYFNPGEPKVVDLECNCWDEKGFFDLGQYENSEECRVDIDEKERLKIICLNCDGGKRLDVVEYRDLRCRSLSGCDGRGYMWVGVHDDPCFQCNGLGKIESTFDKWEQPSECDRCFGFGYRNAKKSTYT
jgi:hypothetical protein